MSNMYIRYRYIYTWILVAAEKNFIATYLPEATAMNFHM